MMKIFHLKIFKNKCIQIVHIDHEVMMIMQNAPARSQLEPSNNFDDDPVLPHSSIENEYENVDSIRNNCCQKNLIPVPSPYRNIDISHPNAPHPTPCPRPTSTSACFYTPSTKNINNFNIYEELEFPASPHFHCYSRSECTKNEPNIKRPVFFSPQPQKPELPPPMDPQGGKKPKPSVKRAVSDGHAQIKTTKRRTRKSFNERKSCLAESGNSNSNRRGQDCCV